MHQIGGEDWRAWYPLIRDALLNLPTTQGKTRQQDGSWTGSGAGCPHFNTALAVLILQMPDSHLVGAGK